MDGKEQARAARTEKKKVVRLLKRIYAEFDKKPYIGDIVVTGEEYFYLLKSARMQLKQMLTTGASIADAPILSVALVQIGIRRYDGNYWIHASEELKVRLNGNCQYLLGTTFLNTLRHHNKYIWDQGSRVQSILFHCFVSDYYAKGLFELLFQYFTNDLERDINRNTKEQMQALMDTIAMRAEEDEASSDAFSVQYLKGSKSYKLRHHTLAAISAYPTHSRARLRRLLRMIDQAFWKGSVPKNPTSRLSIRFKEWIEDSASFKQDYNLYKAGVIRNCGKKHFSSPYLRALIGSTRFELVLPPQIVKNECEMLTWRIMTNSAEYNVQTGVFPVLTGYKTEEARQQFSKDELFGNISCDLICADKVVRHFPPLRKCDIRLFDMEGDYAPRLFKIPMCAYTPRDIVLQSPALLDRVDCGNMLRWDFEFENGDILILPSGENMIVGERYSDGLIPRGRVKNAFYLTDGEHGNIYSCAPNLLLTIPKNKIHGTVIDCNGTRYQLSKCRCYDFEALDAKGCRGFLLPLEQFPDLKESANNCLFVDIPGATYVKRFEFTLIHNFSVIFDGAPYVFQERAAAVFPQDISVNCEMDGVDELKDDNGFTFELCPEKQSLPLVVNQSISVFLEVPVLMWSTDRKNWRLDAPKDTWVQDFFKSSAIYFKPVTWQITMRTDSDAGDDDEDELHEVRAESDQGCLSVDLTRFKSWITREKLWHGITIQVESKEYEFATVYSHSYVVSCETSADYDVGILKCSCDIIGKASYYVDIIHEESGTIIADKRALEHGTLILKDRLRNGKYHIEVFEADPDDCDFDEPTYYSIFSKAQELLNKDDMSGNDLHVRQFKLARHSNLFTSFRRTYWVKDIEKVGLDEYAGELYEDAEDTGYKVNISFVDHEDLRYFTMQFWDDYDEMFTDFLFDSEKELLANEEEPGLPGRIKYRRYKYLDSCDYVFYGSLERPLLGQKEG